MTFPENENQEDKIVEKIKDESDTSESENANKNKSIAEISREAFEKIDDKSIPDPPSTGGKASVTGEEGE